MNTSPVSSLSNWRSRWESYIGLDPRSHEPGFLGPFPYILMLRYFVAVAVILRFWLHRSQYTAPEWFARLLVFSAFILVAAAATYVTLFAKLTPKQSRLLQSAFILTDIAFISVGYWLTNNPESDFFLFYYLPIFAAVEYLESKWEISVVCAGVGAAMLLVVLSMNPLPPPTWTSTGLVLRVLIPRGFFLLAIVLTSAFVFMSLARRRAQLRALLDSLHSAAAAMPNVQVLDGVLEYILSELTEHLGFEFAAISLVDEYRHCIETVRGRNISPGWITRAKHSLDAKDIQSYVANTGETKIVVGWDELLDKEIYDRFDHVRLVRIWAPIVSRDHGVVGTIEAGCDGDRKDEVFTTSVVEKVVQLGLDKGEEIALNRPHVLLKGIAKEVMQMTGADAAALHVYRRRPFGLSEDRNEEWGELILAAGAGRATPEFVRSIQPRPSGRGRHSIRTGRSEWVNDPRQFKAEYPKLYELGIRALAVIPLKIDPDTNGVLGIHFWQAGKRFTPREVNMSETLAVEMEGVIQNYLLLGRATEAGSRELALSGLQNLLQSLASPFNLPDVLKKIAKNALLTFDADNVTVFQFHAADNLIDLPPVTDGYFVDPGAIRAKPGLTSMLLQFIYNGTSQFIIDADNCLVLSQPNDTGRPRFIAREGVKSCAVLILRSSGEIVGLIFVNFRKFHEFGAEEKRAMFAVAQAAALAIRTARLHKANVSSQLEAMRAVHETIARKGPNLDQVLALLLEKTLQLTGAKYGLYMTFDHDTNKLVDMARSGIPTDTVIEPQDVGEGVVGLAATTKKSILVDDVHDSEQSIFVDNVGDVRLVDIYRSLTADTRCELAVPVLDEDQALLGVLNIEHTEPHALTEEHKLLLEKLAVSIVIAIHSVDLYVQLDRRIKQLTSLTMIAARVQENLYELDTILRLFLTGVTAGDGLGFSRAILFLTDADSSLLKGKSAIGSLTRAEADGVWRNLRNIRPAQTMDDLLRQAEQFCYDIREGKATDASPLNRQVQRLSLDLTAVKGAVRRCLEASTPTVVGYNEPDEFREILRLLAQPGDFPQAFACAPLIGKQIKALGVLVVDKRFLPTERLIDQVDLIGLNAFTRLLALSIENLQTTNLERVMHDLRSPAAALKADLSRLQQGFNHLSADDIQGRLEDLTLDIELVLLQVSAVERFLGRWGGRPSVVKPTAIYTDVVLKGVRQLRRFVIHKGIDPNQISCNCESLERIVLYLDPAKVLTAVWNLLLNAVAYAEDDPHAFAIQIELIETQEECIVKFKDWGIGIRQDLVGRVFDLGFRAPEAKAKYVGGAGFGLSNARAVMRELGGDLRLVRNYKPTEFDMILPKRKDVGI